MYIPDDYDRKNRRRFDSRDDILGARAKMCDTIRSTGDCFSHTDTLLTHKIDNYTTVDESIQKTIRSNLNFQMNSAKINGEFKTN